MTAAESGIVLDALVAAFPRTTMSEETVRMYARFLVDVSVEHAVEATARLIARGRGFPLISELREACEIANGSGPPDPDVAFALVRKAVGAVGRYSTPVFKHPAITAAVDAIGWREICDEEHAPSLRKHFATAYESAKKRTADPAHAQLVAGVVHEVKQRLLGAGNVKELK